MPIVTKYSPGAFIPANTVFQKNISHPTGFSSTYTMSQANVSCQSRQLNTTTSPSLEIVSTTEIIFNRTNTLTGLNIICPEATESSARRLLLTSPAKDAVLSAACYLRDSEGTNKYDIIIVGLGHYNYTKVSVCRVIPLVTTLEVLYSDSSNLFFSTWPSFVNYSAPITSVYSSTIGWHTIQMFLRAMEIAQGPIANFVGDVISTYASMSNWDDSDLINENLQEYIRGVLEFSGTLIRTVFTQNDTELFPGNKSVIPESMRVPINGTFHYQSFGWQQNSQAGPVIFLAPTVVAFLSIMIIVVTLVQNVGRTPPTGNAYFDPGDILHVVGAASGTRFRDSYPAFSGEIVKYSEGVHVSLGDVKGGKTGFIVS